VNYTAEQILKLERDSIAAFVLSCRNEIRGRVLDYGCGKQPYKQIVLDHLDDGEYVPHDRAHYPANISVTDVGPDDPLVRAVGPDRTLHGRHWWDTILCNQMIQYHPEPFELLCDFCESLASGGHLILTGPTNWREIEAADLYRFTLEGARTMLASAGFEIVRLEQRAFLDVAPGFQMSLGYGALARV
jgi:SAM-dependent methyltransferase